MIVFVHGVPETAGLWDNLWAAIDRESTAVSLPGFGCPRPAGFGATKDEYVAWLRGELDAIGEPIDLVGHDWGAGFTYRIATAFGDGLRSWVADVASIMHPDYEWHDFAKTWQTPGEGEAFFEQQEATPAEERAPLFEAFGVPHEDAVRMAGWSDATMAGCILDLYRSATPNPAADWGDSWSPTAAPGLVLYPTEDPFDDAARSAEVAEMLGARHEHLDGVGHWWPLQEPAGAAAVLESFWQRLD